MDYSPPREIVSMLHGVVPDFSVPVRRVGFFWGRIASLVGSLTWLFLYGFVTKLTVASALSGQYIWGGSLERERVVAGALVIACLIGLWWFFFSLSEVLAKEGGWLAGSSEALFFFWKGSVRKILWKDFMADIELPGKTRVQSNRVMGDTIIFGLRTAPIFLAGDRLTIIGVSDAQKVYEECVRRINEHSVVPVSPRLKT